jgi:hypothetical protein
MGSTKADPSPGDFEFACNRCNLVRDPSTHPCPQCGCPEYRLIPRTEPEPGRPRAAKEDGHRYAPLPGQSSFAFMDND